MVAKGPHGESTGALTTCPPNSVVRSRAAAMSLTATVIYQYDAPSSERIIPLVASSTGPLVA